MPKKKLFMNVANGLNSVFVELIYLSMLEISFKNRRRIKSQLLLSVTITFIQTLFGRIMFVIPTKCQEFLE